MTISKNYGTALKTLNKKGAEIKIRETLSCSRETRLSIGYRSPRKSFKHSPIRFGKYAAAEEEFTHLPTLLCALQSTVTTVLQEAKGALKKYYGSLKVVE